MLELGIRVIVSLAVVLGLLWATARLGARRMGGGSRSLVRVRGRQPLSRTSSVAVVEVGSRVLVLGVADSGVRLLTELDPEDLEEPAADLDPADLDLAGPDLAGERPPGARSAGSVAAARPGRRRALPAPGARAGAAPGALGGSLLSGDTWKQAWAAATRRQDAAVAVPVNGEPGE
jgi:flagellar protein FliO/FliZ